MHELPEKQILDIIGGTLRGEFTVHSVKVAYGECRGKNCDLNAIVVSIINSLANTLFQHTPSVVANKQIYKKIHEILCEEINDKQRHGESLDELNIDLLVSGCKERVERAQDKLETLEEELQEKVKNIECKNVFGTRVDGLEQRVEILEKRSSLKHLLQDFKTSGQKIVSLRKLISLRGKSSKVKIIILVAGITSFIGAVCSILALYYMLSGTLPFM